MFALESNNDHIKEQRADQLPVCERGWNKIRLDRSQNQHVRNKSVTLLNLDQPQYRSNSRHL